MYQQSTLPNGLIIATDTMPDVESVSVGVFIKAGARAETPEINGVAHYLEHMAFKGTTSRSALDIVQQIEDRGGHMNAYTSYEDTAYHMKMLKEDLPLAVDILGDILQNSIFDATEMERERTVILQEIGQSHDSPDDAVFENLQRLAFPDHAIGRPILGTTETVKSMTPDMLRNFISANYSADRMVLAAAGNVEHDHLAELAQNHFGDFSVQQKDPSKSPAFGKGVKADTRPLEQVHLAIGYEGIPYGHDLYYAANTWSNILGSGMASRLFQEVRETRGLAYSIFSFHSGYSDTGMFGIYAGTSPKDVPELLSVLDKELNKACQDLTAEELQRAKSQMKAGLRMARESTDARMERMVHQLFVYGKHIPLKESLEKIEAVTTDACLQAAKEVTQIETKITAAVGPVENNALTS